ncbi:MAG TPA: isoleucine--tRNA ligase [Candidatus Limnocylindrales bacterium]|nr:isoleucine--tRNA ligase [Candidatus Limnocylindrales bacterium]
MKFKQGSRRKAIEYEKDLVRYWKEHKTFEKSVEMRPASDAYVFYDGPPFITGVPHHGTLLTSVVKDAVPRYWTMKGKRVERRWGWDCHGLPAEVFTEKKLGIKDKRDIGTKISLEEYIVTCRDNMVQTGNLWEDTIDRIGRWVNFQGAYKTMDKDYMESVWWAFKELYNKGKIYEGEKVLLYCTRDATPISKAEVAMDNSYQDVTDPSVYVKFKLKDEDSYLLAWTTTPWTLPSNSAVAVNKDIDYSEVEIDGQKLILAKTLVEKVLTDEKHQQLTYKLLRELKGAELVGKSYEPLFDTYADLGDKAFRVWHADFVHADDGTAIAHESPAYGEEDYLLSKQEGFPWVLNTDENGIYTTGEWKGQNVWEVNKQIAKTLHERGVVWKIDYIRHSYPHCHRCGTKLMYRAHPSWFMDIDSQRAEMLSKNEDITWYPEHIKHGRFAKTVESAPDWNLSRDRFWATAMPVWKGKDNNGQELVKVIGSYAELKELSGAELEDYHRPWIDDVKFTIDGVEYSRIEKVLDCWFESGSMPFAQYHYPFENSDKFKQNFPADFIVEYVPQVRAWFYYLHAVSVGLFKESAFKNSLVHGTIAGNDGRKMSKSFGNYTDPNELMDKFSADALRFVFLSSPLLNGEDFALTDKDVGDVSRKLAMVWNMYDFFTLYADVDGWEWNGNYEDPSGALTNPLDKWVVSRIHQLNQHVDRHMQAYDIPNAMADILPFIDDASNWYVRRSRKRFWKSEDDNDKNDAYKTLHYVLVQLSHVMAPFTPFLAEELFQKLTGMESVHLRDWPTAGRINEALMRDMSELRELITQGLAQRAAAAIKVRQPLSMVTLRPPQEFLAENLTFYTEVVKEELNVKSVLFEAGQDTSETSLRVQIDTTLTPELKQEGKMREVVRQVQSARKAADLSVDDRIKLVLSTDNNELTGAIDKYLDVIKQETLATHFAKDGSGDYETTVKVEGAELGIKLSRVS